ncbi:MAG: hypothetical protein HOW73_03785 [Polyangiaceae bacterium]|nr:hypothetical protein [Polyangiaceae bacterium]
MAERNAGSAVIVLTLVAALALAIGGASACSSTEERRGPLPPNAGSVAASAAPDAPPEVVGPPRSTHVAVLDPSQLAELDRRGFRLPQLVTGEDFVTTAELWRSSPLSTILIALSDDIAATQRSHPDARVTSVLGTRLFDAHWLRSDEMRFELVGVFNRLDRRAFYADTCGEVRFVYRLGYTTQQARESMSGRLPLTINAVFLVPSTDGSCTDAARSWRAPADLVGTSLVEWLVADGALSEANRKRWTLKAVETNLQTVRIQSTAHPTMGGHVEYSLRVFHAVDEQHKAFAPAAMDNMPDVAALSSDPALRSAFLSYLRAPEVLRAIDDGTVQVPERFLAKSARSVAPRGLERRDNRPFSRVLDEEDLEGLDLSTFTTIRSAKALLRRLDGVSCVGCHQSHSIAGFHHVGLDADDAPKWKSLVSGSSTHLLEDIERRETYVEAVAAGRIPSEHRPPAERQGMDGGFGAPCGLGDPGFEAWSCADGLRCVALEDPDVGVCLDDDDAVGAACETGKVVAGTTARKDMVSALTRRTCGPNLGCTGNINGFAQGACVGSCDNSSPSAACVDFVDIDGLQACLRYGKPEEACGEKYVVPRADRACDPKHPCRQDFVCARMGKDGAGACVPPYFVFPLRLDGYPIK